MLTIDNKIYEANKKIEVLEKQVQDLKLLVAANQAEVLNKLKK